MQRTLTSRLIEVDGSIGYGQVLRTAIGLSALLLKPLTITNIRKGRPKPGMMAQHLAGVITTGAFCNAKINGASLGSTEIQFIPKWHQVKDKTIDIGTAGSIPLLLQSLVPLLIFCRKPVTLEMIGGTAGLGAPTIEYMRFITFRILRLLGVPEPEMNIVRQGFYPRGGGLVKITFFPTKRLRPIRMLRCGKLHRVGGASVAGSLSKNVAERQAETAKMVLSQSGLTGLQIGAENVVTHSRGTSITLWAECENSILGADATGAIGKRAETVGMEVATDLLSSINSGKALDKFMSDQIIPFAALADGRSEFTVEDFTDHVITNIAVTERILGVSFEVDKDDKRISVKGIGYIVE